MFSTALLFRNACDRQENFKALFDPKNAFDSQSNFRAPKSEVYICPYLILEMHMTQFNIKAPNLGFHFPHKNACDHHANKLYSTKV